MGEATRAAATAPKLELHCAPLGAARHDMLLKESWRGSRRSRHKYSQEGEGKGASFSRSL